MKGSLCVICLVKVEYIALSYLLSQRELICFLLFAVYSLVTSEVMGLFPDFCPIIPSFVARERHYSDCVPNTC